MLNTTPLLAHTPLPHPLAFVLLKHRKALSALTHGATAQESSLITSELLRSIAVQTVETHGWSWPPILDEEFPAATDGGLKYDSVTIKLVSSTFSFALHADRHSPAARISYL